MTKLLAKQVREQLLSKEMRGTKSSFVFLALGLLLAQGAPVGYVFHSYIFDNAGGASFSQFANNLLINHKSTLFYLWFGTSCVFSFFGLALGHIVDLLRDINDERNRLLGVAAHDLRSPSATLASIADVMALTDMTNLTEEQSHFIERITVLSQHMLQLIDDVLNVSTLEAGELQLSFTECDPNSILDNSIVAQQIIAEQKQITIEKEITQNLNKLSADSAKIEQVLSNLISNSIKYSEPNTTVKVSVEQNSNDTIFSVADQGQGIPAKDISHIFEPFRKSTVKTTGGEKSTGLGLFIVKQIVEGHGGKIDVESSQGSGSNFSVRIPTLN